MDFLSALQWRYAAKRMSGEAVPEKVLAKVLAATRLAPSSFGLQPYAVRVVSDRQKLAEIYQDAAPQPQVRECSHLLVFAIETDLGNSTVDRYMQLIASERAQDMTELAGFSTMIKETIGGFSTESQKREWAARQAYIALGFTLAAAAIERIDSSPMEGFDPIALDNALGLPQDNLASVVLAALGYRDPAKDSLSQMSKVRKAHSRLFQTG